MWSERTRVAAVAALRLNCTRATFGLRNDEGDGVNTSAWLTPSDANRRELAPRKHQAGRPQVGADGRPLRPPGFLFSDNAATGIGL